jgi:peptidoglycan-associated lipoprotein
MIVALALVGCAKQPSTTTGASAPAPGGGIGMTVSPGGMQSASSTAGGGAAAHSMGGSGAARPALEGFQAAADLADIHFEFDRADIREADVPKLDANAGWLKSNAEQLVVIEGHCDERGTTEYNLGLGERRAQAVKSYLVSLGLSGDRLATVSKGKEQPQCTESNEGCWSKNRRGHFIFTAK